MKLKKPKTCEGCKTLYQAQGESMKCLLSFGEENHITRIVNPPKDGCPKPKTVSAFVEIKICV